MDQIISAFQKEPMRMGLLVIASIGLAYYGLMFFIYGATTMVGEAKFRLYQKHNKKGKVQ